MSHPIDEELAKRRKDEILRALMTAKSLIDACEIWHLYAYRDKQEQLEGLIKAVKATFYGDFTIQ